MGFIYKNHILEKIWNKHGVIQEEVDEVLTDPDRITVRTGGARGNNRRYLVIGESEGSRVLRVIFEEEYNGDSQGRLILITAFDAPEADKRRYRRKVRGK
jgi:uncharacterized DUF497 family protein